MIHTTSSFDNFNVIDGQVTAVAPTHHTLEIYLKQAYWEYCKSNTGPPPTPTISNLQPLFRCFFKIKNN